LYFTCCQLNIRLIDHLLIGDGIFSFMEDGLMATVAADCQRLTELLRQK